MYNDGIIVNVSSKFLSYFAGYKIDKKDGQKNYKNNSCNFLVFEHSK